MLRQILILHKLADITSWQQWMSTTQDGTAFSSDPIDHDLEFVEGAVPTLDDNAIQCASGLPCQANPTRRERLPLYAPILTPCRRAANKKSLNGGEC